MLASFLTPEKLRVSKLGETPGLDPQTCFNPRIPGVPEDVKPGEIPGVFMGFKESRSKKVMVEKKNRCRLDCFLQSGRVVHQCRHPGKKRSFEVLYVSGKV